MMTDTIGSGEARLAPAAAARRAGDWLGLAAAPTFAVMALLTGTLAGPQDMMCATAHPSPLSSMVSMYMLMIPFHSAPWLKLISARRGTYRS